MYMFIYLNKYHDVCFIIFVNFLVKLGKELNVPHQMSLAGVISLPVFWLAGAGAAVFWVLGKKWNIQSNTIHFISIAQFQ